MKTEQYELLQSELTRWPGVTYWVEPGKTHPKLHVCYAERERKLPFSSTKVDPRGLLNKVTELRRLLNTLGAERDRV